MMAEVEKGVRVTKLSNVPTDTDKTNKVRKINTDIRKEAEDYMENMRPRRYYKIPMKFWGKGPMPAIFDAYLRKHDTEVIE